MPAKELEVGTKVKHKVKGILGVIVPGLSDPCGPRFVMVDFDGVEGVHSCLVSNLKKMGKIKVCLNHDKCKGCIFANHSKCHRYSPSRFGWMFSSGAGRKIPTKIYPDCQDEVCLMS